jgi:hypothetical protein
VNPTVKDSKVLTTQILMTLIAVPAALLSALILYIALADKPFGTQIATGITYTGSVFYLTFFRSRLSNVGYSLRDAAVQEKLPRLLAMHVALLVLIISVQTFTLALRPHLPAYWLAEHGPKRDNLYEWALILPPLLTGSAQVWISRGVLSRNIDACSRGRKILK